MRERDIYYPISPERLADRLREPADAEQLPYRQPPDGHHDLRPQEIELAQQVRPAVVQHPPTGHPVPAALRLPREAARERGEVDLRARYSCLREPGLEPSARRTRERQPRLDLRHPRRLPDEHHPHRFRDLDDGRVSPFREASRAFQHQLPVSLEQLHARHRNAPSSNIWYERSQGTATSCALHKT